MTTTTTATDNPDTERELAVLRVDHENDTAPQRDIARTTGMSLGMTNAVRGRLSQKGLLTIRRVKGRHMRYAAARDGYHTVVLAGESDLAFHVEHACIHEGLTFVREPKQDKQNNNKVDVSSHAPERPHGAFRLIGEAAPGSRRRDDRRRLAVGRHNRHLPKTGFSYEAPTFMSKYKLTLQKVLSGTADANLRFADIRSLLLRLGFEERVKGSHHLFRMDEVDEKINIQQDGDKAKPYQVRQIRSVIMKYRLGGSK